MLRHSNKFRRGVSSIIAMVFLVLFATLGIAMYSVGALNVQSAYNLQDVLVARNTAESGLRWMSWRFLKMARPKTAVGNITSSVANTLWPNIRTAITNDMATMLTSAERTVTYNSTTGLLTLAPIAVDSNASKFTVTIQQHPVYAGDPLDNRYLKVSSTGSYKGATRTLSMDFKIDKKVKFAIVGKVPVQIGRNTLVEGDIAVTTSKYPPVYMLSDFRHLTSALTTKIDAFDSFLKNNHKGYDNRINTNNPDELAKAAAAGYTDVNGDHFIDEYDLFVKEFDKNSDGVITKSEFTDPATSKLYDADLFTAIDNLGAPLDAADPARAGFQDNQIDNRDGYAKVRGTISMTTLAADWTANLASSGAVIQDEIVGPISPTNGTDIPVQFGADPSSIFDLSPSNFDTSGFAAKTGPSAGATSTTGATVKNKVIGAADANSGATTVQIATAGTTGYSVGDVVLKSDFDTKNSSRSAANKATYTLPLNTANEHTPLGSTTWQATYQRPVFRNMTFVNCQIPKGLNALFDNCKFQGVTFVDLATNITNSSGTTSTNPTDGMTWSQKKFAGTNSFDANKPLVSSSPSASTVQTYGSTQGNNIRFNNCTIQGPLASDVPTAYTHFGNSWEFTGATTFDNQVDQTATMVCPQTNIEMGSFTDPGAAPSTLVGVVVTGNLDIRGSSIVDGSIIVTGDGAGNTTQGWFGPSDSATDPTIPMPEGGYGRLTIRYNPNRAMPDGINIAVDILPDINSYAEGH